MKRAPTDTPGDAPLAPGAPDEAKGWLARFYSAQRDSLCAYLRRKYGSGPPEPEDVVHQAFAKLAQLGEAKVRGLEFPRAFLFRVAENVLIHEKRRTRIQVRHANTIFTEEPLDFDPESVLVLREELAVIEETLRAMPERRRRCFLMHRMDGLSLAEIGRSLSISGTAVANQVERAIADIEAALAAEVRPERF